MQVALRVCGLGPCHLYDQENTAVAASHLKSVLVAL